jgi:hypothetical protein
MPIQTIGRLQAIELRSVWQHEAGDFTPWLAAPENLQFLAESLDLPGLELVKAEHPVDSYSADIVARIVDTEHYVLIENQLERTDHTHMGQILTYAAKFDARIMVWIAKEFTDAHRASLDWMNRITDEKYAFFGVELSAVKIGNSDPAPLFEIVAKPNDWTKASVSPVSRDETLSIYQQSNLEFWAGFHDRVLAAGAPSRQINRPLKDSNYWAPIAGKGRAYLNAYRMQSPKKPQVGVYLGLYNDSGAKAWEILKGQREELDARFGEPLDWSPNATSTVFKICPAILPASATDKSDWPRQYDWMVAQMKKLNTVFSDPVRNAITQALDEAERT